MPTITDSARRASPLVAIVTPVYNGEKYLVETLACVQALDYSPVVHVLLDNASTDATPEIISRFSNGRVPLLVKRNPATIPMIANFNAALGLVPPDAEYFRLLCADDLMATDAISRKVAVAERNPAVDIVGCLERSETTVRDENLPKSREIFDGPEIAASYLRRENTALAGTHFLVRRRQLERRPRFYDETFESRSDAEANLRICLNSRFGFIHEGLATWRRHENNHWDRHERMEIPTVEWLELLVRYGRYFFSAEEYSTSVRAYKRYCLRRLLSLRLRRGETTMFRKHVEKLRGLGLSMGWLDFADAIADRGLLALKHHLRPLQRANKTSAPKPNPAPLP